MQLILASNSPRRKELLHKLNYAFCVVPSNCDESTLAQSPLQTVKELACKKALDVYLTNSQSVVIGCDTVVDCDGRALGKPKDANEAYSMLSALSGRSHYVHTGVCVMSKLSVRLFGVTSKVTFKTLSNRQIEEYVATGSPFDKAGGYGIQDSGFVDCIEGSYDNVMGLPTQELAAVLADCLNK